MPESEPAPTLARKLVSALAVLLVAAGVWWFVEWRGAPPPPPHVEMPGR